MSVEAARACLRRLLDDPESVAEATIFGCGTGCGLTHETE